MPPPPTLSERLGSILLWLSLAVDARRIGRNAGGRIAVPLMMLINDRIREINQRFARLAARIGAGTYVPRRPPATPRRQPAGPRPRRPNALPRTFGWLLPLVPEAVGHRSQLEYLLGDAGMAALLAAAPGPLRRPLRSLCHMLGLPPPPALALPRRPPKPRTPKPRTPKPRTPKPRTPRQARPRAAPASPPQTPAWMRAEPGKTLWSPVQPGAPPAPDRA